jgi:hypothetical protein
VPAYYEHGMSYSFFSQMEWQPVGQGELETPYRRALKMEEEGRCALKMEEEGRRRK